jgi:hypothetical protein
MEPEREEIVVTEAEQQAIEQDGDGFYRRR